MKKSGVGEKRPRDTEDQNKAVEFIPGLKLSQHPPQQRKDLFLKKFTSVVRAMSLHPTDFEGYTIRERFSNMGWEQLLDLNCDKIYYHVVIEWMSSLTKNGDELTGIVDGKSYSITPAVIRGVLGVDTRKDLPYDRFSEISIVENGSRWLEACNTVFGLHGNGKQYKTNWYSRLKMTPVAKILWEILFSALHEDSSVDELKVWPREIYLLHALFTGDVLYSFALLMIDDIWNMCEDEKQHSIPHGPYISMILDHLGAVPKHEGVMLFFPDYCVISRTSFDELDFSESPKEYILVDRLTEQRVTFPKKVIDGEAPSQTKLLNKRQKMANIPKQMKHQVLEAESKEQKKEKWADRRERQAEESEKRAEERERRAEESEKRAEERERRAEESEKLAEERERRAEEREKHAEVKVREGEKRVKEREGKTEERERRAQEREKCLEEREKRAIEIVRQAAIIVQETEKRAIEIVRQAEIKVQEREKRAQEREEKADIRFQEREKCLEERGKWSQETERRAIERERQAEIHVREKEKFAEEREQWAEGRERQTLIRAQEREKRVEEMEIGAKERDKKAEIRAQEMERQAEEREKKAETRVRKIEKWAEEAEVRAQEKERRAEDMERQAEIRAQVREKQVEEREKCVEERVKRAQEIEKRAIEIAKQAEIKVQEREKQFEEMKRVAEERYKMAEIEVQQRLKRAEDMERQVQIWARERGKQQ